MPVTLSLLHSFPEKTEFYGTYWNKRPFLAKGCIDARTLGQCIVPDELAGLSLEDDVRSRIVMSGEAPEDWVCEHGPFDEARFANLPSSKWSLLVQDVEKNHPPTKELLQGFGFSPKWLIDDIMVSYSVPGGGVGPHLDSYHVFLVQGMGKRSWKIGDNAIHTENYIQGLDLKILADEFDGTEVEVERGDVLYIPPKFPHSGETIEESMTYSIGFLGPSLSELMVEFGHFVEEQEALNSRYDGNELDETSSGENMSKSEVENFRGLMREALNSSGFEKWLRGYFENRED